MRLEQEIRFRVGVEVGPLLLLTGAIFERSPFKVVREPE